MAQLTLPAQFQTYDLNVGIMLDIEDMIHLLDPFEAPLQGMNGADGMSVIATDTCFEKKVEWLDENLLLPKSTAAATTTTTQGTIVVASGHGTRFSTGDVLICENEKMKVQSISTDTLTVDRGFAGTTSAQHVTSSVVLILGQALSEGSNPEDPRAIDRTNRYNLTQIFGPTSVRVSATENVVRKYGLRGQSEFDKQVANRSREQIIQVDQAILYGTRYETSDYRTMGGFTEYITTNVNSASTTISEALLLDQLQAVFDLGGRPDRLITGATQKRRISAIATAGGNTLTIDVPRESDTRGAVVNYIDSDFGRLSVVLDRWCRTNDVFAFDRDQAVLCTLRPMQFEMLAKTGDSIYGQVVQEKTLKFRRERHAFRFSALT
jgi:hypothetical protein